MLLNNLFDLEARDVPRFAWSGLRQFNNVDFTTDKICDLHEVPNKQRGNAKKQARQLKYCLLQAEEYFNAARSVSMATKPVLLYYGIVSLALAEILLKQDGLCSLDAARGQHAHHGLDFRVDSDTTHLPELSDSASNLRAVPLIKAQGERFGTFELWHRTSRNSPLAGKLSKILSNGGAMESKHILAQAADEPPEPIGRKGLTLLDCARQLPYMKDILHTHGVVGGTCRTNFEFTQDESSGRNIYRIIIHPAPDIILTEIYEKFQFSSNVVESMQIIEMPSGCILSFDSGYFRSPEGIMWGDGQLHLLSENENLNEFGHLFVSMFILGNYARYYPDKWIMDIDNSSKLFLLSQEISYWTENRCPLLTLSQLNSTVFI